MTHQNRFDAVKDTSIAMLFAMLAIYFTGLCEPWLPIFCGLGAAVRLQRIGVKFSSFVFLVFVACSFLEDRSWFLGSSTGYFGFSGLLLTWAFVLFPKVVELKCWLRVVEVLPAVIVIFLSPLLSAIASPKNPRRGMIDAGVWAKSAEVPLGQEALSTKFQYGYQRFKEIEKAEWVSPKESLKKFDELIIITPTVPFDQQFVGELCEWTSRGGRLLIVADHTNLFGHQTVLQGIVGPLGISLRPDAVFETETNGGIYANLFTEVVGLTPCSISKGVISRLKMTGWSERPDYTRPSFFGELDPSNDDHWGRHVVLGSRRYGLGEVSVFSDSTFFANFAINRWSTNVVLESLFWNRRAAWASCLGLLALVVYLRKPSFWLLISGISIVLLCPSIGFAPQAVESQSNVVSLKPPHSVENDSEERDKGRGSALLASGYAFAVNIRWEESAKYSFSEFLSAKGLVLNTPVGGDGDDIWIRFPTFEIEELRAGRFYIDQNDFWYSQGAGPIRTLNMANCWKSLGAVVAETSGAFGTLAQTDRKIRGSDGKSIVRNVCSFSDNWVVFDKRIVGRWVPDAGKWLVRKEWQLGPWLKGDMLFEPCE